MKTHSLLGVIALACVLPSLSACSQGVPGAAGHNVPMKSAAAASGSTNGSDWTANGAAACDTYLMPDVLDAIFNNPAGHSKKLSGQACSYNTSDFSSITITLVQGGPEVFDAHQKYLTNAVALAGVGDKAVRHATGIEAVKGNDRMCDIDVMPPFGNKLSGEALAQKTGEICNKLFALP
jgi:hypothetical protein